MRHLLLTSLLLCLAISDVTSQFSGIFLSNPTRSFMGQPGSGPRCMLGCQRGYVPGTCLCQPEDRFFPFLFPATPCKFAVCPKGKVCQMEKGRAVCVVIDNNRPSVVVCNLPADPGPCEALMPRYFFDTTDGTCKTFNYGGCQGNKNRFLTKSDCEDTCIANVPAVDTGHSLTQGISAVNVPPSIIITKQNEVCLLPKTVGQCLAYFPSFFYNSTSKQCQEFIYGGCGGNQNRFPSLQACQTTCQGVQPDQTEGPALSSNSDCNLPKEVGLCRAAVPAFYYNTNSGQCESFIYGGCGGNANNFDSRLQCQQKCQGQKGMISGSQSQKPACLLPKQVGPCRARKPRWFFNQQSQSCQLFFYGGCGGNGNRFTSQADCQRQCASSQGTTASSSRPTNGGILSRNSDCNLPKVTGRCRAYVPSYFYNTDTGRCEFFVYGGCRGNANRFESRHHCQQRCK